MFDKLSENYSVSSASRQVTRTYPRVMTRASDVAVHLRRLLPQVPAKKLHKLLYYCQGHHLAMLGTPMFTDEICAWDMGPVVKSLWTQERYGQLVDSPVPPDHLSNEALCIVDYVIHRYGALTGSELERLSHTEPPWIQANQSRNPGGSVPLDPEVMRAYFTDNVREYSGQPEQFLRSPEVQALIQGAPGRRNGPTRIDTPEEIRRRLNALRQNLASPS